MFQQLLQEDFRMLQVVSTGAYYPPVDTTWKILTTGASQLTAGALCGGVVGLSQTRPIPRSPGGDKNARLVERGIPISVNTLSRYSFFQELFCPQLILIPFSDIQRVPLK